MADDRDQAPDANRAPGQQTPSRSYGRQVHPDGQSAPEAAPGADDAQRSDDDTQQTGSPSEAAA